MLQVMQHPHSCSIKGLYQTLTWLTFSGLISSSVQNIWLNILLAVVQLNNLNTHQPLPVLSSTLLSLRWLLVEHLVTESRVEKNPHSLLFVGHKTSWAMWHQTFLSFVKNNCSGWHRAECVCEHGKHKLPFIWIGGRSVPNSPISKLRDVWQTYNCKRNVLCGGDMFLFVFCMRIHSNTT